MTTLVLSLPNSLFSSSYILRKKIKRTTYRFLFPKFLHYLHSFTWDETDAKTWHSDEHSFYDPSVNLRAQDLSECSRYQRGLRLLLTLSALKLSNLDCNNLEGAISNQATIRIWWPFLQQEVPRINIYPSIWFFSTNFNWTSMKTQLVVMHIFMNREARMCQN